MSNATPLTLSYRRHVATLAWRLVWLALALVAAVLLSLCSGATGVTFSDLLTTLTGKADAATRTILFSIRLPRLTAAVVVGAALSLAGCVMQNVLRNPLASSSTLGVSQGAAFGAAFAIVFFEAGVSTAGNSGLGIVATNLYTISLCAFAGGLATTSVILALARFARVSPASMILAGVAMGSMFAGGTALIQYFADDIQVSSIVHWTFGDLGKVGWEEIATIATVSALGFLYFMRNYWNYNALDAGINTATSLGIAVGRLIVISMTVCALLASVCVAFVGTISFIGLIAPHIARHFVGANHRFLLPASALTGATILVLAEWCSRMLISPTVLPIGALTSFLGAPLFLYLIFKGGRRL